MGFHDKGRSHQTESAQKCGHPMSSLDRKERELCLTAAWA
jgi:hypothetical protein